MLGNWLSCRPLNRQKKYKKFASAVQYVHSTQCTVYCTLSFFVLRITGSASFDIDILYIHYSKILIQDLLWILHTSHFHLGSPKRVYTIKVPSMDFVLFGFFNGFVWSGSVCINWTRNTAHGDNYVRRCGGLWVVSLPLGRLARVRISARGLPTVWSEGRQITL